MLEKTFDAASVEPRISEAWDEAGAFRAGAGAEPGAAPYTIVIPPPNVTGSLHMGHALNNTLQDILVRFERMRGRDVLWQPGTDHAGIATQMVVERQMAERQEPNRRAIGREAFVEKVWAWKAESGGTITNQLKRLGASCDWSRERFTMDEGLSRAVLKVFVDLHKKGLIYRDKRLVNWDPKLLTAISDLEVQQVEIKGNLWHLRYPIEGKRFDAEDPSTFIVVATTRPETMLGDTGVAVHPEDERYTHLIGKNVVLPLVGRRIPIVADEYSDPEKGSGAVKITPAHDFNDFEVGRRNNLRVINVMTVEGAIDIANNAEFLKGLVVDTELQETLVSIEARDRFEARKRILAMLEARNLIEKIEPHTHMVPHGDRGGVPIEPFLTDQWYVDAATLAKPAIASVREGRTTFVPKAWEKTYFQWMENIQPWCISRQLWWGHQIPAWYGPDGHVFVELSEAEALAAAAAHYGAPTALTRDEDVLDTWFSSALWPFSTLGWPDDTAEVKRYYPTSVLVTGFDIIFFWVARMMMMGLEFMGTEPFKDVYIHALVRDEKGAKMSKSKGNVIDPLDLVDEYGADALRFTLAAMAAQGRDIKLSTQRIAGYRNFATKLWNAARFAEMNGCVYVSDFEPAAAVDTVNRWIAVECARTVKTVAEAIEAYRFNDAAGAAYRFVWNTFCDWYLEFAKPVLQQDGDSKSKAETRATTAWVLDEVLKLLHPFMPFITEELWAATAREAGLKRPAMLVTTRWSTPGTTDDAAADEINWLVDLITEVRSVRVEMNVPPASQIPLVFVAPDAVIRARIATHEAVIARLARISSIAVVEAAPKASAQIVIGETVACLPLEGVIDVDAERGRLAKELKKLADEIGRIDAKLGNPAFVAKAPEEVVEENREKREEYVQRRAKVDEALKRLG
ncbi:valine--tRNA ligase [Prosthecomicrobium hirschii]|uniref:Valine--tRNA ligase n=1 Tax=Prosthecodimorpha hirschii TaxID=665126 RepID=A0A0P6W9Z6_9HYPH|nr:valine--tRNA ligase [Prosthecomicrobium hirschii]KPL55400.1 valine--tRNA ligase [Prosthecomicrobium hirschii]